MDDEALAEMMRLSGATSMKETAGPALREDVARRRRLVALEHHAAAARGWDHAGWQELRRADKGRPSDPAE